MKRIILILNASRPDTSSIDFTCRVADFQESCVYGILVEDMLEEEADPAPYLTGSAPKAETGVISMDSEQAVRIFKDSFLHKGLEAEALVLEGGPLPYAARESYFADLLVLSPDTSFGERARELPSYFTRNLLHAAACPVLLAPRQFDGIDETIFCYDGSPSSLSALKAYTYLFPVLSKEKLAIVEVGRSGDAVFDEAHRSLLKWSRCHYSEVSFMPLAGEPEEELFQYLFMKHNKMVVLGAYGRSLLSTLFRESTAESLIRTIDLPMFIYHQ
jgi:nucleotide-binding universal stress UspA family protein